MCHIQVKWYWWLILIEYACCLHLASRTWQPDRENPQTHGQVQHLTNLLINKNALIAAPVLSVKLLQDKISFHTMIWIDYCLYSRFKVWVISDWTKGGSRFVPLPCFRLTDSRLSINKCTPLCHTYGPVKMLWSLSLSRNRPTSSQKVDLVSSIRKGEGRKSHTGSDDCHGNEPTGVVVRLYGRGANEMTLKRTITKKKRASWTDVCKPKKTPGSLSGETDAKQKKLNITMWSWVTLQTSWLICFISMSKQQRERQENHRLTYFSFFFFFSSMLVVNSFFLWGCFVLFLLVAAHGRVSSCWSSQLRQRVPPVLAHHLRTLGFKFITRHFLKDVRKTAI